MDDQKKMNQPTTEEEMDALLAQFLATPDEELPSPTFVPEPQPEPPVEEAPAQEPQPARPAFDFELPVFEPLADPEDTEPQQEPEESLQEPEPEEVYEEDEPRKRAPRRKSAYSLLGIPHILSTVIWVALAVIIGASAGRFLWICAADVLAFGREDKSVTLSITEQDDLESITKKLQATGLIEYPSLFKLYAGITDAMDSINPGVYNLNTMYDYHALVNMMSSNTHRVTVKVTIPEGYSCKQIFKLLQDKGVCTVAQLEQSAAQDDLGDYWFLEGVLRGNGHCLEGYLFPDTYEFYANDRPARVLGKFLDNFDKRFTDAMAEKLDSLNASLAAKLAANGMSQEYIDSHKITIRHVVIIASLIEKETAATSESYDISSVIYNRLANPNVYPNLNIDAALVYVLGRPVTEEDKQLDSPYNTYLHPGLIPGPIANPSLSSLNAALSPNETNYYFYALDPGQNRHHFSATLKEHEAFLESLKKED